MSIFRHLEYRKWIQSELKIRKKIDKKLTQQKLAESIGVQKSYLSQVLSGRADFNQDQAYLLSEFFDLSEKEEHYFFLILEMNRTGLKSRKDKLRKKIEKIQKQEQETSRHIEASEVDLHMSDATTYYLEPIHQLVHIALSLEVYKTDLPRLASALGLKESDLIQTVQNLKKMKIIEIKNEKLQSTQKTLHLKRESALFSPWLNAVRLMSLQQLQFNKKPENYSFSVFFSSNEKIRFHLQNRFLDFLTEVQKMVKGSEPESVYQMNFDLIDWLKPKG